jgi:hypothetical protein
MRYNIVIDILFIGSSGAYEFDVVTVRLASWRSYNLSSHGILNKSGNVCKIPFLRGKIRPYRVIIVPTSLSLKIRLLYYDDSPIWICQKMMNFNHKEQRMFFWWKWLWLHLSESCVSNTASEWRASDTLCDFVASGSCIFWCLSSELARVIFWYVF